MTEVKNLNETHILKIVLKGKTFNPNIGVKCYPKQTYGISQQSPHYFNSTSGFIAENGYLYQQQHERQNKQAYLPPFSQNKYCSVVGNTIDVVESFRDSYREGLKKNPLHFHKRKGRLTEFMDKNGWMNQVYKMSGFQRSNQGRQCNNKDRQKNIQSARRYVVYNNPVDKRTSVPKESYLNSSLMTERAKLRISRLELQKQKREQQQIQKMMIVTSQKSPQKDMYAQAEALTNKMRHTLNSRDWRQTMTSMRRKFKKQGKQDKMSMTRSDWSTNNQSQQLKSNRKLISQQKDELKQWFNTNCNVNANPWKYRKAKKMQTVSDQQMMD